MTAEISRFQTFTAKVLCWLAAAGSVAQSTAIAAAVTGDPVNRRIERILVMTPLVDGHNDLPDALYENLQKANTPIDLSINQTHTRSERSALMTDIPRLRAGHVGAVLVGVDTGHDHRSGGRAGHC
jgi:hypothetical protein